MFEFFERRNSMKLKTDQLVLSGVFLVVIGVLSGIPAAEGQTTVGGHVGFVLPLVTHAAGQTTNIADNFSIGFPLGVTFNRPTNTPATTPVTFGMHFGLGF